MLKAQKRLQSIERSEEEARRIEQIDKHIGGLKIVRGAVSNDIPEDGPAGAKKKVKVSLRCTCTCRVHETHKWDFPLMFAQLWDTLS